AIYLLGVGRSFRTLKVKRLIQDGQQSSTIFASTGSGHSLGIQKQIDGSTIARLNGLNAPRLSALAHLLPVQLFDPQSLDVLSGPSLPRRQLLDWGVFHVEHALAEQWSRAGRALQQRNSLLKSAKISNDLLLAWEKELADASEQIHEARMSFMKSWLPFLQSAMTRLLGGFTVAVSYQPGWDTSARLLDLLIMSRTKDMERGFTQLGYHRADIRIRADGVLADERLSRGQLKLCVCALKLSLVERLRLAGSRPVLLFDDLASELDPISRQLMMQWIEEMNLQAWLTAIELEQIDGFCGQMPRRVFHVKQGHIGSVTTQVRTGEE
ncbi:MAG: DNA replication and repair protein RecF, partial [Paraglaciecola sp.]|nr:DNA replication and repair protein RecF [Paraglaciecola sp.]